MAKPGSTDGESEARRKIWIREIDFQSGYPNFRMVQIEQTSPELFLALSSLSAARCAPDLLPTINSYT